MGCARGTLEEASSVHPHSADGADLAVVGEGCESVCVICCPAVWRSRARTSRLATTDKVTAVASAKDVTRMLRLPFIVSSWFSVKDEVDDGTLGARGRPSQRDQTKRGRAATKRTGR